MDSSAIARYIPQKSKKRVFPEGSSSRTEPDVIEIAPPLADQASRSKAKGKQKEVAFHEVIDVDMDEDRNDVVFVEGKVQCDKKMKGTMGISLGPSNSAHVESKKDVTVEPVYTAKSFTPGSNNFFDLDGYVFEDDYLALQSHFDHIDLPTGIEAPMPWLTDFIEKKNKAPVNSLGTSSSKKSSSVWQSNHKNVTSFESPHNIHYQNSPYFSNSLNFQVGSGTSKFSPSPVDPIPEWHTSIMKKAMNLSDAFPGVEDMLMGLNTGNMPTPTSSSVGGSSSGMPMLVDDEVLKRYESFKKFDTVVDHSDHHYSNLKPAMKQAPKTWAKKIQEEWRILEKDLPDTIFVRVYESRMDLLRAVIIGAEGTPYHDGLFFFDVCFPSSYPNSPPLVRYHSGGLRINPNLYNCGKVCLSLLNTWTGDRRERWVPGTSTMLQVLVSIQGLILNTKPYFNEPGYAHSSGSPHGEKCSLQYNENTLILSLKTMVYTMKRPPKNFEDLVVGHFHNRVRDILMACKAYTEGVQVGCLVRGGVQDVDESNKSCSIKFKNDVVSYIRTLVGAFKNIGAKEAEEFLFLSEKRTSPASAPTPAAAAAAAHTSGYTPFQFTPISAYNYY